MDNLARSIDLYKHEEYIPSESVVERLEEIIKDIEDITKEVI